MTIYRRKKIAFCKTKTRHFYFKKKKTDNFEILYGFKECFENMVFNSFIEIP